MAPMLWANLHLLFWLSLIPFATSWMGEHHAASVPTAVYGVALLMPAIAWYILQAVILRREGANSAWCARSVTTSRARFRPCVISPASYWRSWKSVFRRRFTCWSR